VLAAGAAFLVASTATAEIAGQEPSQTRRPHWADLGAVTRSILGGPYQPRVAALVLFSTLTFTLVDFVFKSAADRYVSPDDLGEFFASVYLSFNVLSLVVQVLGVALLLRLVGLVSAVSVVPAVLLISTLGFAVGGGLTLALVLKGADGTLRHSLYRTGTELLFVPLSDRLRTQVKGVIDVLGQRGGQALAAILILMLLSTTANLAVFAALACVTAAAWLVVAVSLREPYLDLFRQTLHAESAPRGTGFPALDMASLETLMATLNTPDDRRVIAALDILEEQGKVAVVPAPLLYHPSPAVVVRSLDLFTAAARDDALLMVSRLLEHTDPGVRAASVRSLSALDPNRSVFEKALLDEDLLVAASARAALVACGWEEGRELALQLRDIVTRGDRAVQQATARALRVRPSPQLEDVVLALLGTEDPEVLSEAITAARVLRTPALVEPLIGLLARRAVREEARAALAGFGPLALERLGAALQSGDLSHGVRRHVPGAIALVGSARAPEILLRHLENEPDGMIRFKVLRALGRWRREQPSFPLDVTLLQGALGYAVSTGFRLMGWRRGLMTAGDVDPTLRTELHDVLVALLRDKQDNALERVFRLLNLQSGSEEFQRVYRGLHSPHAASRAGSRELLHHMVLPPVRKPLLTLVDDLHGEADETSDLPEGGQELSVAYAGVLGEIVECGMESASSLAAAHAVELELVSVRGSLTSVQPLSADHRRTLVSAIRHLARGSA
jgi:HEAT repeat protein